ncbi:methyltransferase domain-containing protein [Novosphingobium sp.]|uniref:methyltransferase domain-containing protein n=1 Tax=Novosphingobium sp. TaxID=1874826 RepID=UPI0025D7A151|nr:methyltransferase domain-containing protein [Novosphingobium sp.]
MAHVQQLKFVEMLANSLSSNFSDRKIIEIGSFDVNGGTRNFFGQSSYIGVDLVEGPGVDLVCDGEKVSEPSESFDLAISCECFEYNPHWQATLLNMHRMTKLGGIVAFSCATTGRLEHGTTRTVAQDSPGTQSVGWDYYQNLTESDFRKALNFENLFSSFRFFRNKVSRDIYFVGIKSGGACIFDFNLDRFTDDFENFIKLDTEMAGFHKKGRLMGGADLRLALASVIPDQSYQNLAYNYKKIKSYLYRT